MSADAALDPKGRTPAQSRALAHSASVEAREALARCNWELRSSTHTLEGAELWAHVATWAREAERSARGLATYAELMLERHKLAEAAELVPGELVVCPACGDEIERTDLGTLRHKRTADHGRRELNADELTDAQRDCEAGR